MNYLVEKNLPFSYRPVAAETSCDTGTMNQLVFALIECIGDGIGLPQVQDLASDTQRLEHKLNLVMFMLNYLIKPTQDRPATCLLRLGSDSIAWQAETPLAQEQIVLIELYLEPMLSLPLQCCARIIGQQEGWCMAQLTGLTEEGMSVWSKWVFRQHRQFVAHSRERDGSHSD